MLFVAKLLHPLKHNVVATARKNRPVTPDKSITPTADNHANLDFAFGKASNEHDIYVYSMTMQAYPHQQDLTSEPARDAIKESSELIPPRILQSVATWLFQPEG
jgi:hypothetical protein